jgi:hypothetical protein
LRCVPQESTITRDLRIGTLLEALLFSIAEDTEDVEDFVVEGVGGATSLGEIVADVGELIAGWVKWCHLLHSEGIEARVEWVSIVDVFFLYNVVGFFEVSQAFEQLDFLLQLLLRVDDWRTIAAEGMWNGGVVAVGNI